MDIFDWKMRYWKEKDGDNFSTSLITQKKLYLYTLLSFVILYNVLQKLFNLSLSSSSSSSSNT